MAEHQVVVVFDVIADTLLGAGEQIAKHLQQTKTRMVTLGVDSWWMPEEPLRSQVDRNDNTPMRLVPDDDVEPDCERCGDGRLNGCPDCDPADPEVS